MTLRWTEQELKAHQLKKALNDAAKPELDFLRKSIAYRKVEAKQNANLVPGRKPKGEMNKWETQFSVQLESLRQAGELVWWAFEPFRIRLAERAFYRPDFVAVDKEGRTHIYEVKGFFREAAKVRLKVAADKLPYQFYLVRKNKGQLKVTPV